MLYEVITGELDAIVAQPPGRRWPIGLAALAGALLSPGDEMLILAPFWPLIRRITSYNVCYTKLLRTVSAIWCSSL